MAESVPEVVPSPKSQIHELPGGGFAGMVKVTGLFPHMVVPGLMLKVAGVLVPIETELVAGAEVQPPAVVTTTLMV